MKIMSGVFLLACASLAVANSHNAYPTEKLAEFVVEKLDLTSIPPELRPNREKGKKTFADFGFTAQKLTENEALVAAPEGHLQITVSILEQRNSGIYVCLNRQGLKESSGTIQRVFLLKLKDSDGLLKGRETPREFQSCPVIGGADQAGRDGYGG